VKAWIGRILTAFDPQRRIFWNFFTAN